VHNVVLEAEKKGLQTLAITEHVRKSYDWVPDYLREIESTKSKIKSDLQVIAGLRQKYWRMDQSTAWQNTLQNTL
jgi:histidinol phosphatase-like PHP family hydrolase